MESERHEEAKSKESEIDQIDQRIEKINQEICEHFSKSNNKSKSSTPPEENKIEDIMSQLQKFHVPQFDGRGDYFR